MSASALALLLLMAAPTTPPASPWTLEIVSEGELYDFPLADHAECLDTLEAARLEDTELDHAECLPGIVTDQDDMEAEQP